MAFEQTALFHANVCGMKNAYFCNGSMFFEGSVNDLTVQDALHSFRLVYTNTVVSPCGEEVAIDFVEDRVHSEI